LYAGVIKRFLDIALSCVLLAILSWLFLLIILAYLAGNHRTIFFVQPRIGWKGKTFSLIKFRTLTEDDRLSPDQRRFSFGDFLRRTSLDELPQLWNVLKGDMSFVGPRPLLVEYLLLFSPQQRRRHEVRPGITGWAQVNGRHTISWPEKFELDLYYLHHVSFWLDVKILFKTLRLLLSFKEDTSLQEKKFTGNG
jgi:lipopolysaccharide/colanic/teichoic acid biosynthesis glycosyltransferase